jgi:lysophospholipase L1-like esterase
MRVAYPSSMIRRAAAAIVLAVALGACAAAGSTAEPAGEHVVRYVALGDSYTIGTAVAEHERWPNQLVARLREDGTTLDLVENLGVNGYTSADLIRDELPRLNELDPELVSLQIGVNDVVQGVPENAYGENVATILDELLGHVPANRILCVATPDYTVTPQGSAYGDALQLTLAIEHANDRMREVCESRGIAHVPEIYELSRNAGNDPRLVADDGLHPSGEQYRRWVEVIAPVVRTLLATG